MPATSHQQEAVFSPQERFSLDPDSPLPLYHQMEKIMLDRISKIEMVDRLLPSEYELIDIFGVSRATVKKTLDNLVSKGLLERRRGIGTRIIKHQIVEDLGRLKGYSEEMGARGVGISSRVLEVVRHLPDPAVARRLALGEGGETISIRRLRGTSEVFPVVLLHSELPADLGLTVEEDYSKSLYALLEREHKVPILWAEQSIEAATATREQARLLEIKTGEPVLIMERVSFSHGDRPIEYVRGVYRHDHYKFSIRLKR